MKKSNVFLMVVGAYVVGILTGLLWASFKGPPPALDHQSAAPASSQVRSPDREAAADSRLAALEEAIKADPNNGSLYVRAGNLMFDQERHDRAVAFYEKAIEILGEDPNVLTDAGIGYRRMRNPQKAVEYFRRASKADPNHIASTYNLGIVLLHDLQDKKGALAAWRRYLSLDPKSEKADHIRGVMAQLEKEAKENSSN